MFHFNLLYLQLKYKEVYERNKAQINMAPDAHEIRAAKEAYKNISNVSLHLLWASAKLNHKADSYYFCFVSP